MTIQLAGKRTYNRNAYMPRNNGTHVWQQSEIDYLLNLRAQGYKRCEMHTEMNRRFSVTCFTKGKIDNKLRDLGIKSGNADNQPTFNKSYLMAATLKHLLDLKRAGHSPTRTEYHITNDNCVRRLEKALVGSFIGSSAAMCSDVG